MTSQSTPPPPEEVPARMAAAIWIVMAFLAGRAPGGPEGLGGRLRTAGRALEPTLRLGAPPPFPGPPEPQALAGALAILRGCPRPLRRLVLTCAVEAAIGSGTLPLPLNLILRTVEEGLGLAAGDLADRFRRRTGSELPLPWDPSLPEAWVGRDGSPGPAGRWDDAPPPLAAAGTPGPWDEARLARIKALALLGLEEGATAEEVRRAFHRVSKVHHPDHYAAHGKEASQEAGQAFLRIKEAYDFLTGTAP